MNIMTVGLSEFQQGFLESLCMESSHVVVDCDDVEHASRLLEDNTKHQKEFSWVLIDSEVRASSNKKLLCLLGALNINTRVQFIGSNINVNKNMPKFCRLQRSEAGARLLKCAMHDIVNSPAPNPDSGQESSKPFVFHYSAQSMPKIDRR
ncbi:MAG: hypothetical protein COB04_03795 [Gammaproteobacteria bacterium]|nr:MAG: hypothetical protein COB04_03795 [Gammaproteobacteria bacterium]